MISLIARALKAKNLCETPVGWRLVITRKSQRASATGFNDESKYVAPIPKTGGCPPVGDNPDYFGTAL